MLFSKNFLTEALLLACVQAAVCAVAFAYEQNPEALIQRGTSEQLLIQLDTNADRRLSYGETLDAPHIADRFFMLDSNQDGFLSPAELYSQPIRQPESFKITQTLASL